MKPALLILAAGIGSRYGGVKQLDSIGPNGETLIDYSIYDAIRAGFGKVVFVIRESIAGDFKEVFIKKLEHHIPVVCVFQEITDVPAGIPVPANRTKPWGTGHAVLMAAGTIREPFAVINADDFYGRKAYQVLTGYYQGWTPDREHDYCMVAYEIGRTLSEYGSVSRGICQTDDASRLVEVVERTRIEQIPGGIVYQDEREHIVHLPPHTVVSMNFWGFTPSFFQQLHQGFDDFIRKNAGNLHAEYYIPLAVNQLIQEQKATVSVLRCDERWYGMTYQEDREGVIAGIRQLIRQGEYPEKLWC